MIEAKIVTDSISPGQVRLTTFVLEYPRLIHAEFMTHRVFSRNASSSRAIPVEKSLARIMEDPVIPVHWGMNQKGMQADKEVDAETAEKAKTIWLKMRNGVMEGCKELADIGIHKQIANRPLEAWSHIAVVVTATDWSNFFSLRCDPAAQPEMRTLAECIRDAYYSSKPMEVPFHKWHLPFIKPEELLTHKNGELIKASIARCARVSYLTHDKKEPNIVDDIALHDKLLSSKHMSPFEHVATPAALRMVRSGNFTGWVQYRKTIPGEHYSHYTPPVRK